MTTPMSKGPMLATSFGRAAATVAYVALVTVFMSNGSRWFGEEDTALTPVFVLLLLVISATVTGLLVLGKPVELLLAGAKKEAGAFLFATLGWLAGFLVLVGVLMAAMR